MLASLGEVLDAPYTVYGRAKTGDMTFAPFTDAAGTSHPNSFNLYQSTYETAADTSVRRAAWASFNAGLAPYQHTMGGTFAIEVAKNIVLAKARGYESAERYLLHEHQVSVRALHQRARHHPGRARAAHAALRAPAPARARSRQAALLRHQGAARPRLRAGDDLRRHRRAARARRSRRSAPSTWRWCAARSERRWIDRADNVGKASGAFCATPYGVHSFILMTWADSMRDAFTLAHELGHAGHFMLAGQHQRRANTDPAMPFVEAPSIMNEVLLARHILAGSADPRMRRWVLTQVLGTYHHNFVTHLLEAELQRQVYRLAEGGQPVTAALLNERKRAILQRFWGDTVEIDDGAAMTWMRQPHYYLGLYPYTYSVGLVAATALAEKSNREGDAVLSQWLDVLRAGGTLPPLELMRQVGIDLSSQQPIRDAVAYVGRLIEELEASF